MRQLLRVAGPEREPTGSLIGSEARSEYRLVARYEGAHKVKSFSCLDQFLSMAFAQLTYRESLRDIEACLRAQRQAVTVAQFASDSGAKRSRRAADATALSVCVKAS